VQANQQLQLNQQQMEVGQPKPKASRSLGQSTGLQAFAECYPLQKNLSQTN
jgi:hypothetical protein